MSRKGPLASVQPNPILGTLRLHSNAARPRGQCALGRQQEGDCGRNVRGAGAPRSSSFVSRHQFLIFRLFSLAGLVPVGGYLVVHLLTNATILNGPGAFQTQVDRIHSLGVILPLVEWTFIFIPILFHAVVGWLIISGAVPEHEFAIPTPAISATCCSGRPESSLSSSSSTTCCNCITWVALGRSAGSSIPNMRPRRPPWRSTARCGSKWSTRSASCRACFTLPTASGPAALPGESGPAAPRSGELVMWSQFSASGWALSALSALTGMTMTGASSARLEEAKQVEDRMERARRVHRRQDRADPSLPPAAPVPAATEQTSENHFPAGTRGGRLPANPDRNELTPWQTTCDDRRRRIGRLGGRHEAGRTGHRRRPDEPDARSSARTASAPRAASTASTISRGSRATTSGCTSTTPSTAATSCSISRRSRK